MTEGLVRTYAPMAGVAAAVLVADQLSKAWADDLTTCSELAVQGRRPTVGFCLAYNEGMAFSVGWGSGAIIALVALFPAPARPAGEGGPARAALGGLGQAVEGGEGAGGAWSVRGGAKRTGAVPPLPRGDSGGSSGRSPEVGR